MGRVRTMISKDAIRIAKGWVLPLVLLTWWEINSHLDDVHAYICVPLELVVRALVDTVSSGELWTNWQASFLRTGLGFLIGAATGISVGAIMALSRWADRIINPLYTAIRQVPLLGWIPLISLWMGNGSTSKIFIVALASFYPTVLNTYDGLVNVDRRHLAVATVYGVNRWQYLRHIALPSASPSIFTGLMQATAFAWISSVGSEFFFNPGPGLGNLMLNGQAALRMEIVILAVLAITLTGTLMNASLLALSKRALRWRNAKS